MSSFPLNSVLVNGALFSQFPIVSTFALNPLRPTINLPSSFHLQHPLTFNITNNLFHSLSHICLSQLRLCKKVSSNKAKSCCSPLLPLFILFNLLLLLRNSFYIFLFLSLTLPALCPSFLPSCCHVLLGVLNQGNRKPLLEQYQTTSSSPSSFIVPLVIM